MFNFLKKLFSASPKQVAPANTQEQLDNYDNFASKRKPDIDILLVGVSFGNDVGPHRQHIIANLRLYETVFLHREFDNPHSKKAVAVKNSQGYTLGYLPDASGISKRVDKGEIFHCLVGKFFGGEFEKETRNFALWGYIIPAQTA
jgi:hypothetical protein